MNLRRRANYFVQISDNDKAPGVRFTAGESRSEGKKRNEENSNWEGNEIGNMWKEKNFDIIYGNREKGERKVVLCYGTMKYI